MQIRITKDNQQGNVQFSCGEVLSLPKALAEQFIDAGNAVIIPKAERATLSARGISR